MTHHFATRQLRFFLTAPSPCPYLPGRNERKVFAHLPLTDGPTVNDTLTEVGFRRSQNIAYRPACDGCDACVSVRIPVDGYPFARSERRVLERNGDISRHLVEAEATLEQFELLRRYLVEAEATLEQFELLRRYLVVRHAEGGMADMIWADYVAMVEDTAVRTHLIEYRLPSDDRGPGELIACALVDILKDGLSLVYSFYDPKLSRRSLGSFVILDHVRQAQGAGVPYVYLGYWVAGSIKMAYKARFNPLEVLRPGGWRLLSQRERTATP